MIEKKELIDFLKTGELFHDLSEEELLLLLPLIRVETYSKDTFILKEEEKGDDLYLIQKGVVEILKKDSESETLYRLALLHSGDWFGEMAILGTKIRMTSARALEKTEVVALHLKDLDTLSEKSSAFSKIARNLAKTATKRLETANDVAVKSLKEELRLIKSHDHMSRFIIYLFILLTLFVYTLKFFSQYGANSPFSQLIIYFLILFFGVSCVLLVKGSGYPRDFYGLTLNGWRKSIQDAVLFTIPILIFMTALKWFLIKTIPEFSQLSVFQFDQQPKSFFQKSFNHFWGSTQKPMDLPLLLIVYTALVPVQEFIARGCLQGSLRNFFTSPNRALLAILTSNLLFGLFHSLKSFTFALCAFILGIFWGWIYERQQTLVGPCISHSLVGIWAFGVLNYQSILIY